ncbi:amidohydrolase family protein [Nesterenkonia sp. LB17]|uniref:N-acetylglucosamine-6-phosphate deacetylase n=1 Tax=unclassified Nesterenkonia TaxID=2629769 RepID=UPI001F4C9037|nr:amidohydrolase family protein [Nesterenkonia sp. LB17]MCH8571920.1 amidohydrolase family protein [Nesterenkonia sp. AY15]
MTRLLFAEAALTPEGSIGPYWLRLAEGRILDAGHGHPPARPDLHLTDQVLAPGFVDVHAHGGGGSAFTEGAGAARTVLAAHRRRGSTTMLASLVSAPIPTLLDQAEQLRPLVEADELAGVHLEGPWLSIAHRGAHEASMLSDPTPAAVSAVLEHAAADLIRYVTLAPELPGATGAAARLRAAGWTVGIGHTGADGAQTRAALTAGASAATHLFNAMSGLHHRDPGPALALLEDPTAFLELIHDGVHLDPEMVRYVWHSAARNGGSRRLVLVSDAMAGAAAPEGRYALGAAIVDVARGVARLVEPDGTLGAIAGSAVTLAEAVRRSILNAGITPAQALMAATANPAEMIGIDDVGRLLPGGRADLVLLDQAWTVREVMHRGQWLDGPGSGAPQRDGPAD